MNSPSYQHEINEDMYNNDENEKLPIIKKIDVKKADAFNLGIIPKLIASVFFLSMFLIIGSFSRNFSFFKLGFSALNSNNFSPGI